MKASDVPGEISVPFANTGSKNTIPVSTATAGLASYDVGFPAITFQDLAAGGQPPYGKDFNGILYALSANIRWNNAAGVFPYSSSFSTAIGGYPKGAIVSSSANDGFWFSSVDDNTTDPSADTSGKWLPWNAQGYSAVALAGSNVTLTPDQYASPTIELTGTITSNIQVTFPQINGIRWRVHNNTSGSYTVTLKCASGNLITADQGLTAEVRSDGTSLQWDDNDLYALQALRSTDPSKGAALVGLTHGTVRDAIYFSTPEMFGAKGDGVTDDTAAFNDALATGSVLDLAPGKIYLISSINPPAGATIRFNGAVLKSLANSHQPIFSDATGNKSGLYLENATLDGNMPNNVANTTGGIWLSNWSNVHLAGKTTIYNAYRDALNFTNCDGIYCEDFEAYNLGSSAGSYPNLGYGIELQSGTKNVHFGRINIHDLDGFGIHFYTAVNCTAGECYLENMRSPSGIGITYTQADNIIIDALQIKGTNGDALECNASSNIVVNVLKITNAGNRALLFGDNGTGISNKNVNYKNVTLSGITNASIAGSHIDYVQIEQLISDGSVSISMSDVDQYIRQLHLKDCQVQLATIDRTFITCENCLLTDQGTCAYKTFFEFKQIIGLASLATGANHAFSLLSNGGTMAAYAGEIAYSMHYTDSFSQFTVSKQMFAYTSSGQFTVIAEIDGSVARKLTFSMPTQSSLQAANSTGVTLAGSVEVSQIL